jgi:BirA family biotin operon repressor/biotin-[acetyl-CoA-carboxylase] ligase
MEPIPIRNPFPGAGCFLVESAESTQDEAKRLARDGFPSGSLVAAEEQTAGRGRFPDRPWLSERGMNLLFTIAFGTETAAVSALPLRAGAALCRAVSLQALISGAVPPRPPRLKWPNDLLFGDRKAAGILCEASAAGTFIGVGVNCNQESFPPEIADRATSLALELGARVDRWSLLETFLDLLSLSLAAEDWREGFDELLWRRGERLCFVPGAPERSAPIEGVYLGVGKDGSVLMRSADGRTLSFPSGEFAFP